MYTDACKPNCKMSKQDLGDQLSDEKEAAVRNLDQAPDPDNPRLIDNIIQQARKITKRNWKLISLGRSFQSLCRGSHKIEN